MFSLLSIVYSVIKFSNGLVPRASTRVQYRAELSESISYHLNHVCFSYNYDLIRGSVFTVRLHHMDTNPC
jgi:hypothetical protein